MDVYECLAPVGAELMVKTLRELECGDDLCRRRRIIRWLRWRRF